MIGEFPLLLFTMLTGLAAGGYAMAFVADLLRKERKTSWLFVAVMIVLLGLGMLASLLHLGHPERFLNSFSNPSSMITQEGIFAMAFGLLMFIDAIMLKVGRGGGMVVPGLGAIVGAALTVITSVLYATAYGYPVWTQPLTFGVFLVADLAMGGALVVAWRKALGAKEEAEASDAPGKPSERQVALTTVILGAIAAVAYACETAVFAQAGLGFVAFVAAAIVAVAGCVTAWCSLKGDAKSTTMAWTCFALFVAAACIARWGFYAIV